jgi:hypothetical protein
VLGRDMRLFWNVMLICGRTLGQLFMVCYLLLGGLVFWSGVIRMMVC